MKKELKIILGVISVVVVLLIIGAYFLMNDIKQEVVLRNIIDNYIEKQIIPEKTSTTGEYYKIEKEILNYLTNNKRYTDELTTIFKEIYDFEFFYANNAYESLKDNFKSDEEKLDKLEEDLNSKLEEVIELNNYEVLLDNYKSDEAYYNELYVELLGSKEGMNEAKEIYSDFKTTYKEYFLISNKYIDFLKESTLIIEDDKENMMFETDEEILKYEELAEELNDVLSKIIAID